MPENKTTPEPGCKLEYILITPARNEDKFIEKTIQSVISQTVRPKKWVIVSDASTDRTDEIVKQYLPDNDWIKLIRLGENCDRNFAAKVRCFNAAYEIIKDESYDIIGNLDADISFDEEFYDYILGKFLEDEKLGVAGTPFVEEGFKSYDHGFVNFDHVSGAVQTFRRLCFEEIGGYVPVAGGGIDWIAVTTARMKGWKTRTYTGKVCYHARKMGTAESGKLAANFRLGANDYYLGGHLLWQFFRSVLQVKERPYVIGGLFLFAGYLVAFARRVHRPVSSELIKFHQKEQMQRLKNVFRK
jgi:glycosyltransferase involved in cell wall biosynthesis